MSKGIGAVQAAAMLLAGIFIGSKFKPSLLLCFALFCISTAGGIFFFRKGRKYTLDQPPKKISRVLFCISLLALGMGRTAIVSHERPAGSIENFVQKGTVNFNGIVIAPPTVTSSRTTVRIEAESRQDSDESPNCGKLLLVFYSRPAAEFHYGDRLRIRGTVTLPPDTGSSFSYRTYLERDGITAIINNPGTELLPGFGGDPLLSEIFRLRAVLLERIYRLFPKPENALMAGILLGDESKITSEVEHDFQKTGTAHIIAISGANFTVLTWLILSILRKLIHHWWAPVFMLPFIWFYTVLVGGNSAVVRAAIMCSLSILGMMIGRTGNGINSLALTAAVMGLAKPLILYDLGFQLSVTATAGILFFSEPISGAVRWLISKIIPKISENALNTAVDVLKDLCILSISAQIFTMWVSAQAFGRISLISLPANFLIAPFQALIMLGGFAALLLSFIFYPIGAAAAWLVWPAPALTIRIVQRCAGIRWGSVYFDLPPLQAWLIIALIAAVFFGRRALIRSVRARNFWPYAFLLLIFVAVMIWVNAFDHLDRRTVIEFNSTRSSQELLICSPENRTFIIADGMTNYAAQKLLERQVLPVRRIPAAAWISIQEYWMTREFLESGTGDDLSVLYLNGRSERKTQDLPEKLTRGSVFAADGIELHMAASYLNRQGWIIISEGKQILFPNGIPMERIFSHDGPNLTDIDVVVLGKRDDADVWRTISASRGGQPTLLDRSSEGSVTLYISKKGIGFL